MKRRIMLISLVLVLIMTVMLPAGAMARNDWSGSRSATTDFTGAGTIFVTYFPDPVMDGTTWSFNDEIVEGMLQQCDWEALQGAGFWSEHDSIVEVDEYYNAEGHMRGTFILATPDGVLQGTFSGRISGNLATMDISDVGSWRATGGTGVFEGVKAWGKWSAQLSFNEDYGTLVGPLSWEGKYLEPPGQSKAPKWGHSNAWGTGRSAGWNSGPFGSQGGCPSGWNNGRTW